MPKSRRDRTIALTRTSKKQGIEHKEKVSSKNKSRPYLGFPSVFLGFKFRTREYFLNFSQKFVYRSQKTNPKIATDTRSKNPAEDGTLKTMIKPYSLDY